MKFCYVDESGTGNEPIAVMVGVVVDAQRMHVTKKEWNELLAELSTIIKQKVTEIHTRDFYAGNGPWRSIDGQRRAEYISTVLQWVKARRHRIAYTAVDTAEFFQRFKLLPEYADVTTLWRFLGLHLILGIQREHQKLAKNKGNTVFIFDNEYREELRFTDLINNPPTWTDTYYNKNSKQSRLDQVIDVPYWGDSTDVGLIQVADFIAYFLRRYIEINENKVPPKYKDEEDRVTEWFKLIVDCMLPNASFYPKKGRCACADLFFSFAPDCIRSL
ncbi:MAG: DUF3800 domain-containing protein [Caldilineaceae bacterium]|nr:DUF3800 domain-containing protein [Caldilineaceae bacterium]